MRKRGRKSLTGACERTHKDQGMRKHKTWRSREWNKIRMVGQGWRTTKRAQKGFSSYWWENWGLRSWEAGRGWQWATSQGDTVVISKTPLVAQCQVSFAFHWIVLLPVIRAEYWENDGWIQGQHLGCTWRGETQNCKARDEDSAVIQTRRNNGLGP